MGPKHALVYLLTWDNDHTLIPLPGGGSVCVPAGWRIFSAPVAALEGVPLFIMCAR